MMAKYLPNYVNSYALVVGINTYNHQELPPLAQAEQDAVRFTKLLTDSPYLFNVKMLLGKEATKEAIQEALFDLRFKGPDDRILVYFASHGIMQTNKNNQDMGFLAITDTDPQKDYTAIRLDEVMSVRHYSVTKHIAFVFDTCFSSQLLGVASRTSESFSHDNFLTKSAYQAMSASADQSFKSKTMTGFIVDILRSGNVDPKTETLTLTDLGVQLKNIFASLVAQNQVPQFGHLYDSEDGEFVFKQSNTSLLPPVVDNLLSDIPELREAALTSLRKSLEQSGLRKLARDHLAKIIQSSLGEQLRSNAENLTNQEVQLEPARLLEELLNADLDRGNINAANQVLRHLTREEPKHPKLAEYAAQISALRNSKWQDDVGAYHLRANSARPGLVVFVLNCTESMSDSYLGSRRTESMTNIMRGIVSTMVARSSRGITVSLRYHIAVYAYAHDQTADLLGGVKDIDEFAQMRFPQLLTEGVESPVFAFEMIEEMLRDNYAQYRAGPPPVICHITDGEQKPTSDLVTITRRIMKMNTEDGHVLITNILLSDDILPIATEEHQWQGFKLEDLDGSYPLMTWARMSSPLPSSYAIELRDQGYYMNAGSPMLFPGRFADLISAVVPQPGDAAKAVPAK